MPTYIRYGPIVRCLLRVEANENLKCRGEKDYIFVACGPRGSRVYCASENGRYYKSELLTLTNAACSHFCVSYFYSGLSGLSNS